jgi:hypothetical protein
LKPRALIFLTGQNLFLPGFSLLGNIIAVSIGSLLP